MEYIQILQNKLSSVHLPHESWMLILAVAIVFVIAEGWMLISKGKKR